MRAFVVGGAGFIGSHLVAKLLSDGNTVRAFDDLSVGRVWWIPARGVVERGDARNLLHLESSMRDFEPDIVFHLAANPDARKGLTDHRLDLELGLHTTINALEACRRTGTNRFVFLSSGTVYGDRGGPGDDTRGNADASIYSLPSSLYGASKLAAEAYCSAYAEVHGIDVTIYRLANIIGPHATHGAILDFLRRLKANPHKLEVLGDGTATKQYVHVTECARRIVEGLNDLTMIQHIASMQHIRVSRIAELCADECFVRTGVRPEIAYGTTQGGWLGDVPFTRLPFAGDSSRHMMAATAVERAVKEIADEVWC